MKVVNLSRRMEFGYRESVGRLVLPTLFLLISLLVAIYLTISLIFPSIKPPSSPGSLDSLLIISFIVTFLVPVSSMFINIYPKFRFSDEGLHIRIFSYKFVWKVIPWNLIIDIQSTGKYFHQHELWSIILDHDVSFWHHKFRERVLGHKNPAIFFSSDLALVFFFLQELGKYTDCSALQEKN